MPIIDSAVAGCFKLHVQAFRVKVGGGGEGDGPQLEFGRIVVVPQS